MGPGKMIHVNPSNRSAETGNVYMEFLVGLVGEKSVEFRAADEFEFLHFIGDSTFTRLFFEREIEGSCRADTRDALVTLNSSLRRDSNWLRWLARFESEACND